MKPGFHTCVSRTHHSLKMYGHQWSQAITAFATKACELATKSHMLNFCEGLCRGMLWLWPIETNNARKNKISCLSERKSKAKNNDNVRKVVISDKMQETKKNFWPPKKKGKAKKKMPNAIRNLHASKNKRPRNKPHDGCLWKPAKRNNVRMNKQFRVVASTETGIQA